MKQANINTIKNYLATLPDSAAEQVITFVSYLNYLKNIDCGYPYPDEQRTIDQYRNAPDTLMDWDRIKDTI